MIPLDDGNSYELTVTSQGVPTFRHLATGENLHGQAGPWQEAHSLYVAPSRLATRKGPVVIYDVGMGCAAQVLASFAAAAGNEALGRCHVVSFDLEKKGLEALLAHEESFPYAKPFRPLVSQVLEKDFAEATLENGVTVCWEFLGGDFRTTAHSARFLSLPQADLVFYDFFSPARHPSLWTSELFRALFRQTSPEAMIFTYSCATAVRAAMVSAGFYVGFGIPSGKKAKTTIGARRLEDLAEPLPQGWLQTFLASHAAYSPAENEASRTEIRARVMAHPQFRNET